MSTTPTPAPKPAVPAKPIELHTAILALKPQGLMEMRQTLDQNHLAVAEFGPTYSKIAATSPQHAATFAAAYTRNLQTPDQIHRLFSAVAQAPAADRKAIIVANRENHNGIGVVHAIGALP